MSELSVSAEALAATSSGERVELATKVSRFLSREHENEDISPIVELAMLLVEDVSRSVRETLTKGLLHAVDMPEELAMSIAGDEIDISGPFFSATTAFDDERLAELLKKLDSELQIVIAARKDIGEKTVASIAAFGSMESAWTLVRNSEITISEQAGLSMVKRFPKETMLMEVMAMRAQMPLSILSELVELVSAHVREGLQERIIQEGVETDEIARSVRYEAIWNQMAGARADRTHAFALDLRKNDRLEHDLVIFMWEKKSMLFVESALSLLTGAERSTIRNLLEGADPKMFARLIKGADVTREQYDRYIALLREATVR